MHKKTKPKKPKKFSQRTKTMPHNNRNCCSSENFSQISIFGLNFLYMHSILEGFFCLFLEDCFMS